MDQKRADDAANALHAAFAGAADLAPAFERLKAENGATVDAALDLARTARKQSSDRLRAVRPATQGLTGKYKALK